MKTSSNVSPLPIRVAESHKAWVILTENVIEETTETEDGVETVFSYDEYRLETEPREGLLLDVTENFQEWLTKAKKIEFETLAEKAREKRNRLLSETDHFFYTDRAEAVPSGMADYRQALRDLPDQSGFPHEINWPILPK